MPRWISFLVFCLAIGAASAAGAGEFIISPNVGAVFGGDTAESHTSFGLGLGYFGDGLLGFEVDFAYTPDFFADSAGLVPDNSLTTLMGNIVLSGKFGSDSRLYASGGAGLMRPNVDSPGDLFDDIGDDDLGVNVGAGLLFALGEKAGLRGDVRYFRNLTGSEDDIVFGVDFGDFDYWRATGGLSLRF